MTVCEAAVFYACTQSCRKVWLFSLGTQAFPDMCVIHIAHIGEGLVHNLWLFHQTIILLYTIIYYYECCLVVGTVELKTFTNHATFCEKKVCEHIHVRATNMH